MEEKSTFKDWKDRTKASIKEREVKKTLVSHWHDHKGTYIGVAVGAGLMFVVTRDRTGSSTASTRSLSLNVLARDSGNINSIVIQKPGNSGDVLLDPKNKTLYYSKGQASRELGMSRQDVRNLIEAGALTKIQDGDVSRLELS